MMAAMLLSADTPAATNGELLDTGVYAWRNTVNGKVYVGSSSTSLKVRKGTHQCELSGGYHGNKHLQAAWDKYGAAAFEWSILERCFPDDCIAREQHWIDFYKAADRRHGYNASPTAGSSRGCVRTAEMKARISASRTGKARGENNRQSKFSAEQIVEIRRLLAAGVRQKEIAKRFGTVQCTISAIRRGQNWSWHEEGAADAMNAPPVKHSPEVVEANRQRQLGKKLSAETKAKIGAKSKGRKHSTETRLKISVARKGMVFTAEHKLNMSISKKAAVTVEVRMKLSQASRKRKNTKRSAATRAKISAAHKGKVLSAEHRAKLKAAWVKRKENSVTEERPTTTETGLFNCN